MVDKRRDITGYEENVELRYLTRELAELLAAYTCPLCNSPMDDMPRECPEVSHSRAYTAIAATVRMHQIISKKGKWKRKAK